MKSSRQCGDALATEYGGRYENALKPAATALREHLADLLKAEPRIDRVTARAKDPASFLKKAQALANGKQKYSEPLAQIQDQIGARIIVFFKADVERLDGIVKSYFKLIEYRDRIPESEWEFGYFGRHYVLVLPSDVKGDFLDKSMLPDFFELQIKTLFQHAWSEAEHDLGYKPGSIPLSSDEKRKLAYTSAQAWGADQMFDELFRSRSTVVIK
ncbi:MULTISPECIES: RelA/SpoT domain-containing protein [unclassified Bradyrhizobium]|uniref:GTP pyrophosphokinase n=1 Tax=unclassified Bradyrhizobium TaxID=2631580 RepID=UPI0028F0BF46|nr:MULTISPECIES: RelA/SpoT domain-containing protein [unclassified Bradyrhizobium]